MRVGLYARISTQEQQTLKLQTEAMLDYVERRGWSAAFQIEDIGSGAEEREGRETLMKAARQRQLDVILVWKLDRWGRSLGDLVTTLDELNELNVGFVSLTEALDLTTKTGRAMAGLLAVFAEFERELLRERVKAGIAKSRSKGTVWGRPRSAAKHQKKVKELFEQGLSKSEIARQVGIGRTSVRRILEENSNS